MSRSAAATRNAWAASGPGQDVGGDHATPLGPLKLVNRTSGDPASTARTWPPGAAGQARSMPERQGTGPGTLRPPEDLPVQLAILRPHDSHPGEVRPPVVDADSPQRDLGSGPRIGPGRAVRDAAVRPSGAPAAGADRVPARPAQAADEQAAAPPELHRARPDLTS